MASAAAASAAALSVVRLRAPHCCCRRRILCPARRLMSSSSSSSSSSAAASPWARVTLEPPDAVFGVTDAWARDKRPLKINLGVGAYRDDRGMPFLLPSVVQAESLVVSDATRNKEYLPIDGHPGFRRHAATLAYGPDCKSLAEDRVAVAQTLSGTGALYVGAAFIARQLNGKSGCASPSSAASRPPQQLLVPDPTWGNHLTLGRMAGLDVQRYRYVAKSIDASSGTAAAATATAEAIAPKLDLDGMLHDLEAAPDGAVVLLHACAHNPTGIDPVPAQWARIADLMVRKRHIAFFDMAYQGFATGCLDKDAGALRAFEARGDIPVMLAQSFAKNMGLYGERVGALSVVCSSTDERDRVQSHLRTIIRPLYSNPPAHGARIAEKVLSSPELYRQWKLDLGIMSSRLADMRAALRKGLEAAGSNHDWSHITDQIGMFCYTGLSKEQVARLATDFGVYMTSDGRISIAGINNSNVQHLAQSIHAVSSG